MSMAHDFKGSSRLEVLAKVSGCVVAVVLPPRGSEYEVCRGARDCYTCRCFEDPLKDLVTISLSSVDLSGGFGYDL